MPLSKIFTITDEAYALTMVLNQCSNWKESAKPKNNRQSAAMKKMFTNAGSGSRRSWSAEGQTIFKAVCLEVEKLRADAKTGTEFEKAILQHYRATCPRYKARLQRQKQKQMDEPVENEPECYLGDGLLEMFAADDDDPKNSLETQKIAAV